MKVSEAIKKYNLMEQKKDCFGIPYNYKVFTREEWKNGTQTIYSVIQDELAKEEGDVIISKRFTRRKKDYTLIARFNKGDYIGGVLTDDQTAIIDGRGFSLDFLLQLTREELKGA